MKTRKLTEFMTQEQVLAEWPVSKSFLYRARKEGLNFYRLGAFVCYRPEELEEFFGNRKKDVPKDTPSRV